MKAVIDGKRYDTDKAERVFTWTNGQSSGDFKYREKSLYRTPKGSWFIYHDGGAMTDMAKSCGSNSWTGSERIEPLTPEEARRFLESKGGVKALETHFADHIEDA